MRFLKENIYSLGKIAQKWKLLELFWLLKIYLGSVVAALWKETSFGPELRPTLSLNPSSLICCALNRSLESLRLLAFSLTRRLIMSTPDHDMHPKRGGAWLYWSLTILTAVICRPTMCLAQSSAYELILSYNDVWLLPRMTNLSQFA